MLSRPSFRCESAATPSVRPYKPKATFSPASHLTALSVERGLYRYEPSQYPEVLLPDWTVCSSTGAVVSSSIHRKLETLVLEAQRSLLSQIIVRAMFV
jgi:hypothetical protein